MDTTMTTVRLPTDLYESLRRRAFEQRRPAVEIIREALVAWLAEAERAEPLPPLTSDPLWQSVGIVSGGSPDEAESHDSHLYADRAAETGPPYEETQPPEARGKKARSRRPRKP